MVFTSNDNAVPVDGNYIYFKDTGEVHTLKPHLTQEGFNLPTSPILDLNELAALYPESANKPTIRVAHGTDSEEPSYITKVYQWYVVDNNFPQDQTKEVIVW
jgi:hypothetical protein